MSKIINQSHIYIYICNAWWIYPCIFINLFLVCFMSFYSTFTSAPVAFYNISYCNRTAFIMFTGFWSWEQYLTYRKCSRFISPTWQSRFLDGSFLTSVRKTHGIFCCTEPRRRIIAADKLYYEGCCFTNWTWTDELNTFSDQPFTRTNAILSRFPLIL